MSRTLIVLLVLALTSGCRRASDYAPAEAYKKWTDRLIVTAGL